MERRAGAMGLGLNAMTTGFEAAVSYDDLMHEGKPFIELRIDLKNPPDLVDLVGYFAAIASQFELYLRRSHPNLKGAARLFVQDIRQGSIIVELIPVIQPLIANMDTALIVDGFVQRVSGLLRKYIAGEKDEDASKGEINDLLATVRLIATNADATSTISSLDYHKTNKTTRLKMEFNTREAVAARDALQLQKATIDLPAFEASENKMMVFVQTTVKPSEVGKKTNLKGVIEAVSPKPLAITYETDLAREKVESEIREDEKNVYKKGFFVDFYTERFGGKPVAYRITTVRKIVPLPDD